MNGFNVVTTEKVGPNPGPSWELVGSAGFNGSGHSDLLWQNATGQAAIWEMSGLNVTATARVGPNPGTNWHAIGLT
jgi:hypothetical protein